VSKIKIQYCSDLHLEFQENRNFLANNPLIIKGNILLLAGDIIPFTVMDKHAGFFSWAADNFEYTYWIPGNHEYYHSDIENRSGIINEKIRTNVFLVNNQSITLQDLRIIFTTLWSKISPANYRTVQRSISDFQVIKSGRKKFDPEHFNQLHQDALQFLTTACEEKHEGKTVVVTHHVPTFMNYPEIYKGSDLNDVFGVELYDLIEQSRSNYWIYGHHHQNIPEFEVGSTLMITNQLGYVQLGENAGFSRDRIIDL
jgi:predicted phosphohydrolase